MSVEDVDKTVGPNGKAILNELRIIERNNPQLIKLKDTPMGLQICVIARDVEIQLVQMWGAADNEGAQSLETKMQWITGRVFLNNSERMRIATLLQRAHFKPTTGSYGNFRLGFDEAKTKTAFDATEMAKLRDAIVEMAKLVRSLKN